MLEQNIGSVTSASLSHEFMLLDVTLGSDEGFPYTS